MNNELLPCPFCGDEAKLTKLNQKGFKDEFKVFIKCSKCGSRTNTEYPMPHYSYLARAERVIKIWNTRVTPPNPPLTLEQLKECVDKPVWVETSHYGNAWLFFMGFVGFQDFTVKFINRIGCPQYLRLSEINATSSYWWKAYDREPRGE